MYYEKINFPLDIDNPFGGYVYSRISDPMVEKLENALAEMENAKFCLAFSSGMSAISTLFWTVLKPGDHAIVSEDCYSEKLFKAAKGNRSCRQFRQCKFVY